MKKLNQKDVLSYSPGRKNADTVKRHYIEWRNNQNPPLPLRCDNPDCYFHNNKLVWNGQRLELILDHINGVNGDNNPTNLRFLCPNCNAQQPTTGGGNRGRVKQESDGFTVNRDDGNKDISIFLSEDIKLGASFDAEVIKGDGSKNT